MASSNHNGAQPVTDQPAQESHSSLRHRGAQLESSVTSEGESTNILAANTGSTPAQSTTSNADEQLSDNVNGKNDGEPADQKSKDRPAGRGDEYSCNICFEKASEPVLTLCGHIYCWSCLHQWMQRSGENPLCPVCKAATGEDKVIPIYGRGTDAADPRSRSAQHVPRRPTGRRPSHENQNRNPAATVVPPFNGLFHTGQAGGHQYFTMSGGFGFFPMGFGMQFNYPQQPLDAEQTALQMLLSRLFLLLGFLALLTVFLF